MDERKRVKAIAKPKSPDKVPQHRHCQVCFKVIPLDQTMCSEACKLEWQGMMKKKRNQLIFIWVLAIIVLIVALVAYSQ